MTVCLTDFSLGQTRRTEIWQGGEFSYRLALAPNAPATY